MKRSEISITLNQRKTVLAAEATRRLAVNKKAVKERRMAPLTANREYLIIQECLELVQALERRGLDWRDLLQLIEEADVKSGRHPRQGSIQFPI